MLRALCYSLVYCGAVVVQLTRRDTRRLSCDQATRYSYTWQLHSDQRYTPADNSFSVSAKCRTAQYLTVLIQTHVFLLIIKMAGKEQKYIRSVFYTTLTLPTKRIV